MSCCHFQLLYIKMHVYYRSPLRSRGKAIMFYSCTFFFFFQKVISEVTERISAILSHNIQSRCNLIMHPQKLVDLYLPQKNHPTPPQKKIGIFETEFDIRWRITLKRNFTSTIVALVHYEGPSSVNPKKRVNFDPKMRDYSLSGN